MRFNYYESLNRLQYHVKLFNDIRIYYINTSSHCGINPHRWTRRSAIAKNKPIVLIHLQFQTEVCFWWLFWCSKNKRKVNKKAELSQRWPRNAPHISVPWKLSGVPDYAQGHFSEIINGLFFRLMLWICVQNLKFVVLPILEIKGGIQKIWAVPGYAHVPFSPKFLRGWVRMHPVNVPAKFEVLCFTRSWVNSDWSFGWGLQTRTLGGEEAVWGRGWYRSKERLWLPIGPQQ